MKTTAEWLDEIKSDKDKLNHWLKRQYVGEVNAARRIKALISVASPTFAPLINSIANDESNHSEWIKVLLMKRGLHIPDTSDGENKYWQPILSSGAKTFEEIAAIGHHAETMRLVRIEALAFDSEIDDDIRMTFARILVDERGHAWAFEYMSTREAIEKMRPLHQEGMKTLGLVI